MGFGGTSGGFGVGSGAAVTAHDLGGASHNEDTLADLNSKVSDATLIDTGDSRLSDARTPSGSAGGDLAGTYPSPTISNLADITINSLIIDSTGVEALLVRDDGDTGDVLIVDTTNNRIRLNGHASFGNIAPGAENLINANETVALTGALVGTRISVTNTDGTVSVASGVLAEATVEGGFPQVRGGDFTAIGNTASNFGGTFWVGVQALIKTLASQAGTITDGHTFLARVPEFNSSIRPTDIYGLRVMNHGSAGITNTYGIKIENQTGSTNIFPIHQSGTTGLNILNAKSQLAEVEIDGDLDHDGSNVGFYGTTPVTQASKINDPSGGATVDAESRTAINSIIDALEGMGITSL